MTTLKLATHTILPGRRVIEIWDGGDFIGQITPDDGRGVRIISKFPMSTQTVLEGDDLLPGINLTRITIGDGR